MGEKWNGAFKEIRRNIISEADDEHRSCYMGMDGRVSLAELIDHLNVVAPGKGLDEIGINFATVRWVDDATAEEKQARAEWRQSNAARHEKWERETFERLKAKFDPDLGVGDQTTAPLSRAPYVPQIDPHGDYSKLVDGIQDAISRPAEREVGEPT